MYTTFAEIFSYSVPFSELHQQEQDSLIPLFTLVTKLITILTDAYKSVSHKAATTTDNGNMNHIHTITEHV